MLTEYSHRHFLRFALLVPTIAMVTGSLLQTAWADVDFGGSLRLRYENKVDFNLDDSEQDYFLTQLRLYMDWKPSDKDQVLVELQDARVFGEVKTAFPPINADAQNQSFEDPLDIHRLFYVRKWDGGQVKVGRQKFNLGDLRLVASLEWVNTARVHDAVRVSVGDAKKRKADLFLSKLVSIDPDGFNNQSKSNNRYFDSSFHGAFVADKITLQDDELEYWYFVRDNGDFNDTVHTIGARYVAEAGGWNVDIQGAFQTGDFSGLNHSAYMFHVGGERGALGGKLGFAYNHGSGDSDPTDTDHETFDNLYPLNHAYYGYMDLFSLQNIHNLEAVYEKGIGAKTKLRVALQSFWLADTSDAWYNAALAGNTDRLAAALAAKAAGMSVDSHVGSEIDITLKYPLNKKWVLAGGYSHFFAGGYTEDTGNSRDANFFVLMTKVTF